MRASCSSAYRAAGIALAVVLSAAPGPCLELEAAELSAGELAQLVSPIALHPDALVSQILMASTYPLEVVQAARWVESHGELAGEALAKALEGEPWDPSVKSLVAFPSILDMMNSRLDWSQGLGDAFLAQPNDVMAAIQELRRAAKSAGSLASTSEQVVATEAEVIGIESTEDEVVYVPVYDPAVVYGVWVYPAYAPDYYYRPRGWVRGPYRVVVGPAWDHASGWCDWNRGAIGIGTPGTPGVGAGTPGTPGVGAGAPGAPGTWQHDPAHRRGVGYADAATTAKYRGGNVSDASSRTAYRGHAKETAGSARAAAGSEARAAPSQPRRGGVCGDGSTGTQTRAYSERGRSSAQKSSGSRGGARQGRRG